MSINKNCTIIDVTLRDGGYKNNFDFSINEVETIIQFLQKINVDGIEVGYRNGSFWANTNIGISGLCHNTYLRYIKNILADKGINMVVMLHPKNVSLVDIEELAQVGVNFIRVCLPKSIDKHTIEIVRRIKTLNIDFSFNIIRITEYSLDSLRAYLDTMLFIKPNVLYVADSNGNLNPETTENLFKLLKCYGIQLGFHGHNNLDLAMANTIAAIKSGASFIDASIAGLGKGAGNLKLKSLISYINSLNSYSKYDLCSSLEAKSYVENLSCFSKITEPIDTIMGYFNLSQNYTNKLNKIVSIKSLFKEAKVLKTENITI